MHPYPLEMLDCKRCDLHETRTQVVPGRGNPQSALWLLGEAPGKDEDEQGVAFVGRAGRLLDRCLDRVEVVPEEIFILNVLKCRPPENRNPKEGEMRACLPWLIQQFSMFPHPKVIVAMGRFAIGVLQAKKWNNILKMRVTQQVGHAFKTEAGMLVVPTFHPAYALRNGGAVKDFLVHLRKAKRFAD